MIEQEMSDRAFAKMLANSFFGTSINKLPFVVNSQQYEYFVEEWNKLNEIEDKDMSVY